jgi:hypothetical protein
MALAVFSKGPWKGRKMIPENLRTPLLVTVAVVWVINFVAGLVAQFTGFEYDQTTAVSINGIFTTIFGGALALGAKKSSSSNGSNNNA